MFCLEAVQDCLEDGVGIVGEPPLWGAQHVDGTAPRILHDAADVPQGLVRCVVSAVFFVFLGCGRYAVCVPFLELVAAGGEERAEVGFSVWCFRCAGAQQGGEFLFRGPDVMDELLEGGVRWCSRVAGVALHAACLCRPAHGGRECWRIRAAQDGVRGPVIPVPGAVVVLGQEPQYGWEGVVWQGGRG